MKKIIIFGGEGYIGKVLSKSLIDKNYNVASYDNLTYEDQWFSFSSWHLGKNILEEANLLIVSRGFSNTQLSLIESLENFSKNLFLNWKK